jgi:glutathione synthase/RimK-type ligase-like ATP-grasp enzyme
MAIISLGHTVCGMTATLPCALILSTPQGSKHTHTWRQSLNSCGVDVTEITGCSAVDGENGWTGLPFGEGGFVLPLVPQTEWFVHLGSALESSGWRVLDSLSSRAREVTDKYGFFLEQRQAGLPCLSSVLVAPFSLVPEDGPFPCVIKGRRGSSGRAVRRARSSEEARAAVAELSPLFDDGLIVQPYQVLSDGAPADVRVHVLDGEIRAVLARTAAEGNWSTAVAAGASCVEYHGEFLEEACELALRAATLSRLRWVAVDMLILDDGLFVCEVNTIPGIAGATEVLGKTWLDGVVRDLVSSL